MKRRLRVQYLFIFIGALLILPLLMVATLVKTNLNDVIVEEPDYVPQEVNNHYLPVVNTVIKAINPYTDAGVSIKKTYYDYKATEESQINSILLHENTYMQNTGIDYVSENVFDVVAILEGTVVNVKEDELLGKMVEIKHNNGDISIYQSLGDIKVKKGDIITQGQIIGTSGTNELEKDLGNHLHFEIYKNGQSINPENYLNKEVTSEKGN